MSETEKELRIFFGTCDRYQQGIPERLLVTKYGPHGEHASPTMRWRFPRCDPHYLPLLSIHNLHDFNLHACLVIGSLVSSLFNSLAHAYTKGQP
jgi:hypothetical protein